MRTLILIGIFFLASCDNQSAESTAVFERHIPDTTKSWAGQMTKESYREVKRLEDKLGLYTLSYGVDNIEFRLWNFSSYYDPQVLFILKSDSTNEWNMRTIEFYKSKGDSIYTDYSRKIRQSAVDSLSLNRYWTLPSQSDLKLGDSYGCMDGGDVFVELANSAKYRFMWYRCPDINKHKDSVFLTANDLADRLNALSVEH